MRIGRLLPALLLVSPLAAQRIAPPPILQIFREELKPGHSAAHTVTERGWPQAFAAAKSANNYIALTSMFGPNEVWFLEGHANLADYEKSSNAIEANVALTRRLQQLATEDGNHLNASRIVLARYHAALSNDVSIDLPAHHIYEITIFRLRPGQEAKFFETATIYQGLVAKARAHFPWAVYEVMAGMPGPTFLVIAPHRSIAEIDPGAEGMQALQKVTTEEIQKKLATLGEGFLSMETLVFSTSPEMSYVDDEWIRSDPAYWGRKSATALPRSVPVPKP